MKQVTSNGITLSFEDTAAGTTTVTITAAANTGSTSRTAVFRFITASGSVDLTVTQAAASSGGKI